MQLKKRNRPLAVEVLRSIQPEKMKGITTSERYKEAVVVIVVAAAAAVVVFVVLVVVVVVVFRLHFKPCFLLNEVSTPSQCPPWFFIQERYKLCGHRL